MISLWRRAPLHPILLALFCATVWGCSPNFSKVDVRTCTTNAECPTGQCVEGFCTLTVLPDLDASDQDMEPEADLMSLDLPDEGTLDMDPEDEPAEDMTQADATDADAQDDAQDMPGEDLREEDLREPDLTEDLTEDSEEPDLPEEDLAEPDMGEPDVVEPDLSDPDMVEPDMVEPDVVEPDMVEPDTVEPDMVEPDMGEPDVVEPDMVEPDMVEPDMVEPDMVEPDMNDPDLPEEDLVEPDMGEPDVVEPDLPEEDMGAPDMELCPDMPDSDGDGEGDACDTDDDNDGVLDEEDNCPLLANAEQRDTDGDGEGDTCDTDDDNDGVLDPEDNCPIEANADQRDSDFDRAGDACDQDDDNDGVLDQEDNCPLIANGEQLVAGDGAGLGCDSGCQDAQGQAAGRAYQVLDRWRAPGYSSPGSTTLYSVAAWRDGRVAIADRFNRDGQENHLYFFDITGRLLGTRSGVEQPGPGAALLDTHHLSVGQGTQALYVAPGTAPSNVAVYGPGGDFSRLLRPQDRGEILSFPVSFVLEDATDPERLWLASRQEATLLYTDQSGEVLGRLHLPEGSSVTCLAQDPASQELYVLDDSSRKRVLVYSAAQPQGEHSEEPLRWFAVGEGDDELPDLDWDAARGRLYLTHRTLGAVLIYSRQGDLLGMVDQEQIQGGLEEPRGLAILPVSGGSDRMVVADLGNGEVKVLLMPEPSLNDGDAWIDACDVCPGLDNLVNELGELTCIDLAMDEDADGIVDAQDNCPTLPNPGQEDRDWDDVGDLCDGDGDNDGRPDEQDNCPQVFNPEQADRDQDGLGDACEGPCFAPSGQAAGQALAVVGDFGGAGAGPGQMQGPQGLGFFPDGRLVVAEQGGQRFQIFDVQGQHLRTVSQAGDAGALRPLRHLWVSPTSGHIVVVGGTQPGALSLFDHQGDYLRDISTGLDGVEVAVEDSQGQFWVGTLGGLVHVLDPEGQPLRTLGNDLGPIYSLALNEQDQEVYVADAENARVLVYALGGGYLRAFALETGGQPVPGLSWDASRRQLSVTSRDQGRVYLYGPGGQLRGTVELPGSAQQLLEPWAAVTYGDRLFIADAGRDAVTVVALPDAAPSPDGDLWLQACDACPDMANELNHPDLSCEALSQDQDGDGVLNVQDNCLMDANEDQRDSDLDGVGDVCDLDRDGDGVPNGQDNCPDIDNESQDPALCDPCLALSSSALARVGAWTPAWGGQGQEPPAGLRGLAVDGLGHLYAAASTQGQVLRFDAGGSPLGSFGSEGTGQGQLINPQDVAVSPDGARIYVADTGNHRVQVWTRGGAFVESFGQPGMTQGRFNQPFALAFGAQGRLYVADHNNQRVQIFNAQHQAVGAWSTGSLKPTGLAVDSQGRVLVVGLGDTRVQIYSAEGSSLDRIALHLVPGGTTPELSQGSQVAVDQGDRIYVTLVQAARTLVFGPDWGYLGDLRRPTDTNPSPWGVVAVGSALYVSDLLDGVHTYLGFEDEDGDSWLDLCDLCPGDPEPLNLDLDGDGLGDRCDGDKDDDGVQDELDNCPGVANAQQVDNNHDGLGDFCDPCLAGDGRTLGRQGQLLSTWYPEGVGAGRNMTVGPQGEIYVLGYSFPLVVVLNPQGEVIRSLDRPPELGGLTDPAAIAVHPFTGEIYISQNETRTSHNPVFRLSPEGEYLGELMLEELVRPEAMAFDSQGLLYVSDSDNSQPQVRVFEGEQEVRRWDVGVVPRSIAATREGNLLVAGFNNGGQALLMDPYGQELMRIGSMEAGVSYPSLATVGPDGSFYLFDDMMESDIYVFSAAGDFLYRLSQRQEGWYRFSGVQAMAVDVLGNLLVSTSEGLQRFLAGEDLDQDGLVDACGLRVDTDADGVPDSLDSCPELPNPAQGSLCLPCEGEQGEDLRNQGAVLNSYELHGDNVQDLVELPDGRIAALRPSHGYIMLLTDWTQDHYISGDIYGGRSLSYGQVSGLLYVAQPERGRILGFDLQGTQRVTLTEAAGASPSAMEPYEVQEDRDGNLWVADRSGHRVLKLDAQGNYLGQLGNGFRGESRGRLNQPVSVSLDEEQGLVYVGEVWDSGGRVQVFDTDGASVGEILGFTDRQGQTAHLEEVIWDRFNDQLYVNVAGEQSALLLYDAQGEPLGQRQGSAQRLGLGQGSLYLVHQEPYVPMGEIRQIVMDRDEDQNTVRDACQLPGDADGDGMPDEADLCPLFYSPGVQEPLCYPCASSGGADYNFEWLGSLDVYDAGSYTDLAELPGGRLAVVDGQLGVLDLFNAGGGREARLSAPTGGQGWVDPASVSYGAGSGHLYVSEGDANRIAVLDAQGTLVRYIVSLDSGADSLHRPHGTWETSQGYLWVADSAAHRVLLLDLADDSILLEVGGVQGSGAAQLSTPVDVALDERLGVLYVADLDNQRVQRLQANSGAPLEPSSVSFGPSGAFHDLAWDPYNHKLYATADDTALYESDDQGQGNPNSSYAGSPQGIALGQGLFYRLYREGNLTRIERYGVGLDLDDNDQRDACAR